MMAPLAWPVSYLVWRVSARPDELHVRRLREYAAERARWQRETSPGTPIPGPSLQVLVAPGAATATPVAVQPRPRLPAGVRLPWGIGRWLRHGAITAHGAVVAVTGSKGRTLQLPRAGFAEPGVAGLAICRWSVQSYNYRSRGPVRRRDQLSLLGRDRQRLVDLELYGWSEPDLRAFAQATGLSLERYWLNEVYRVVPDVWGRMAPSPLELALPPALGYRRLPGRAWWPEVISVTGLVLAVLGMMWGTWTVAWLVTTGLAGDISPTAANVVAAVPTGAVTFGGARALIALLQWLDHRQDRNRPLDAA